MAGTRDRKLYIAALGVALGGLALDRIVLNGGALGPVEAEAASPDAPDPGAALVGAPFEPAPDATAQLAGRLKQLEQERGLDLAEVRNAFWLDGFTKVPEAPASGEADEVIEAFRKAHSLRAVMTGPQGRFVVVGEDRLEIGDALEVKVGERTATFTLMEIRVNGAGRWAVFNFDGRAVELGMDDRNVAGTGG